MIDVKPYKKGYVSVLVNPATQERKWVSPNDIQVNINGIEQSLGAVLQELQNQKVSINELTQFKLKTKKSFDEMKTVLRLLVSQTEINNLDINAIQDIMEENNNDEN